MEFTSLWDGAGDAAETAANDRSLAMAKAASQGFWPFLAGAQTEQEYVHREALAEEKITLAAEAAGITTVALAQALKSDWDILAEARQVTAGPTCTTPGCGGKAQDPANYSTNKCATCAAKDGPQPKTSASEPPPFSVEGAKAWDVRAYTYDADMHCPGCAEKRFGKNADGEVHGKDSEGNDVHPVFHSDEVPEEGEYCGTCHGEISEPHKTARKVRHLAIVHVAGFPPSDGDDDGKADMDGDGQDDDDPNAVAPQSTGYYVLDEDSNLDIGGPYASKADASDAIDAGVFDADPEGVTVQKGTVAENGGGDVDPNADPDADPQADPDAPPADDSGDDDKGGNPFAKGAAQEYRRECPRCGHEWESRTANVERCPECGAPLDKQGSLTTQANPYTDDNPYSGKDNGPDETSPLAGGADQTDAPGGSMTTKPRQLPSGGAPAPSTDSNVPQPGADPGKIPPGE